MVTTLLVGCTADTGMTQLHPAVADMDPRLVPLSEQPDFDLASIDIVVNTHLHFDHCGGNVLFAGRPIYVQRQELEDARGQEDYTIPEWVEFEGATYVEHDGEAEIAHGVRVIPTPGHTAGHQSVLVDTDDGLVVLGGDVGYTWKLFDASESGQLLMSLRPRRIWLAHQAEPRDLG